MTMKITERVLLDGFSSYSVLGEAVSVVSGRCVYWHYRRGGNLNLTTYDRREAVKLTLERDMDAVVGLDSGCADHPKLDEMAEACDRVFGTSAW